MTSRPPLIRVLSGIGAVFVFFAALVASFGAAVGAPLGIYLVRRWAARRQRLPNRIASLFGAVAASSLIGAVIWTVLVSRMPGPTQEELNRAATEAHSHPAVRLPAWYPKVFPQAARSDSASEKLLRSPGFMRMVMVMSVFIVAAVLGVIGGSLGWCAALLLAIATTGSGAPAPPAAFATS